MRKYNIKFISGLFLMLLIAVWACGIAPAQNAGGHVTVIQLFDPEDVSITPEPGGFDLVMLKDRDAIYPQDEPGTPWLPAKYVNILIPEGAKVTDVSVVAFGEVKLVSGLNAYPVQPPAALNNIDGKKKIPTFVGPKRYAYTETGKKPLIVPDKAKDAGGFTVVPVRVNPIRLIPITGELFVATEIEITVSY